MFVTLFLNLWSPIVVCNVVICTPEIPRIQKQPAERERRGQRLQRGWVVLRSLQLRRLVWWLIHVLCWVFLFFFLLFWSDLDGKLWKWEWQVLLAGPEPKLRGDKEPQREGKEEEKSRGQEERSLCCNSNLHHRFLFVFFKAIFNTTVLHFLPL